MLDLFKRPDDPPDFFGLYAIPAAILVSSMALAGGLGLGSLEGASGATGIASAVCCILAIAGLANQKTARSGNVIGIAGVGLGLASTVGDMSIGGGEKGRESDRKSQR
jgi:NAD(P) transhydrogenase